MFVLGINSLAYGHYSITGAVVDTTPDWEPGDIVLSAYDAATNLIRPGRPSLYNFPLGQDPVEARLEHEDQQRRLARGRIRGAAVQLQKQPLPDDAKLNEPLVHAVVNAAIYNYYPAALDIDFTPDDVAALHEVAKNFCDSGVRPDEVKRRLHIIVAMMRELLHENDEVDEEEPDGEVLDELE